MIVLQNVFYNFYINHYLYIYTKLIKMYTKIELKQVKPLNSQNLHFIIFPDVSSVHLMDMFEIRYICPSGSTGNMLDFIQ